MKGIIIAAGAGVGKSYLGKKYKNILDFDTVQIPLQWSSKGLEHLSIEERKGLYRELNPNYPQNVIDELIKQRKNYDIILIGPPYQTHKFFEDKEKQVADYLFKHNIEFYIAMPSEKGVEIILQRMKERGNPEQFINQFAACYPAHIKEFLKDKYKKIPILDGEYLEDTLIRHGFIGKNSCGRGSWT